MIAVICWPPSVTLDGNGNVIGLVDMATGVKSATYDYNAFGETIQSDGVASVANHFRFSTKYSDDETGLYYYGYRFYQPTTGRWLSRDPIEEDGGVNLYGFVENDPISEFDIDGRSIGHHISLNWLGIPTSEPRHRKRHSVDLSEIWTVILKHISTLGVGAAVKGNWSVTAGEFWQGGYEIEAVGEVASCTFEEDGKPGVMFTGTASIGLKGGVGVGGEAGFHMEKGPALTQQSCRKCENNLTAIEAELSAVGELIGGGGKFTAEFPLGHWDTSKGFHSTFDYPKLSLSAGGQGAEAFLGVKATGFKSGSYSWPVN